MWNHRRLEESIQNRIEVIIRDHIPTYKMGPGERTSGTL